MATKLNHPVTRKLTYTCYAYKGKVKDVKVTLTPQETLVFSIAGTRHKIEINLAHCLNLAEIQTMNAKYREQTQLYKEGRRKRKPKKVFYPYSDVYIRSIETLKSL